MVNKLFDFVIHRLWGNVHRQKRAFTDDVRLYPQLVIFEPVESQ